MTEKLSLKKSHSIIICAGADQPALNQVAELIKTYEKVTYIGVDNGCLALLAHDLPLNYAVGDFDSVNAEEFEMIQNTADQVITSPSEKDDTDMELALKKAGELDSKADFYIFGALGVKLNRLDHLISNLWLASQPRFRSIIGALTFIENNHHLRFYLPGQYEIKHEKNAEYLSLISLTPVKNLTIKGSKYELDQVDYDFPKANISNEFREDGSPVTLRFSEGIMMVIWEWK